mmetsp:Transcript_8502/g.20770  ORF Transcript_8502/g.20770 Transcript_8502/m.20770 type:complete len:129 (+) Transcript_8502:185-571(+)
MAPKPRGRSILQHDEWPEPPARATHARVDASAGGVGDVGDHRVKRSPTRPKGQHSPALSSHVVGAHTKPTRADRYAALIATRRAQGKVRAQDAAMMLPPLLDRPGRVAKASNKAPSWAVKDERKPFRF